MHYLQHLPQMDNAFADILSLSPAEVSCLSGISRNHYNINSRSQQRVLAAAQSLWNASNCPFHRAPTGRDVLWSIAMVRSRSFDSRSVNGGFIMMPVADLFDHSVKNNVRIEISPESIVATAATNVSLGDEVCPKLACHDPY